MKLTINQIAELAQVSKGTVSKVLNGHKGISPATRDRILKLVKQLDYQPDASARALALQKTGVLGFLIPHEAATSLNGQYWTIVLSGISQEAARLGYQIMVLTTPREGDIQAILVNLLKRSTVDGLIIGSELLDKQGLSTLVLHKIPFVLLGQNPEFQHYSVDIDNFQASVRLVTHMVDQGYRKIGALFGPGHYPYVKERLNGYRQALDSRGLTWRASSFSEYDPASIGQTLRSLLQDHPDMDALYLASGGDFLFDTFKLFRERGIQIPDFGLGVFDDYPFLELISPPVTAIRQPLFGAGQEAVALLLHLIQGTPPAKPLVQLSTELVVRGSCGELTPNGGFTPAK
jgi:LacI family transcriptional regulator